MDLTKDAGVDSLYAEAESSFEHWEMVKDLVDVDDEDRIKINSRGETSHPGIFAAGDVRDGSTNQVASAALNEFSETTGAWLTMASFLLFGIYLGPVLTELTWPIVGYGVLSLVVFRIAAVTLSLVGSGLDRASVLYLGWFGPRGLATIILSWAYPAEMPLVSATGLRRGPRLRDAAVHNDGRLRLQDFAHGPTSETASSPAGARPN